MNIDNVDNEFLEKILASCYIDAMTIWQKSRQCFLENDFKNQKKYDILNKILNNCILPGSCVIGRGSYLAYGGLGVLVHKNSILGDYCIIGANATLASGPVLEDFIYVGAGARLVGQGIKLGPFAVIGANAVVTKDVPPFSIVGGVPARIIRRVTSAEIPTLLRRYFPKALAEKSVEEIIAAILEKYKLEIPQNAGN